MEKVEQDIQTIENQLAHAELRSRELSKLIGQAKKQGNDAQELILQKKQLQQEEITPLIKQIEQVSSSETKHHSEQLSHKARKQGAEIVLPDPYSSSEYGSGSQAQLKISALEWQAELPIQKVWQDYVAQHAYGGIYCHWEFLSALQKAHGHRILLFIAKNSQGDFVGCIPIIEQKSALFGHLWTSIALVNYGGVLADNAEIEARLLDNLSQSASKEGVKRLEVRGLYKRPVSERLESTHWQLQTDKASMWLPLPKDYDSDTLLKQFKAKLRSQIKKGYTEQVSAKVGQEALLEDFYTVFARNMRDLGTPVYSKKLFKEILAALGDTAQLIVVYHKSRPASAAFLIKNRERMEVPWASTIRDYNRFGLNMVLYWEVLKYACERECSIFDFGRSSIDASTFKFKKQWGAQAIQHYWYAYEPNTEKKPSEAESTSAKVSTDNPKFKLLIACWKRLPVWLSKIIGPRIVKLIP